MVALDPRLHPFRPEIAAKYLQGQVEAARFVEGQRFEVVEPVADLRRAPSHEAPLDSQVLLGECMTVYETTGEGWARRQPIKCARCARWCSRAPISRRRR